MHVRGIAVVPGLIVFLVSACGQPTRECLRLPTEAAPKRPVAGSCERRPDLCGLPSKSIVNNPDYSKAIDIVFLSEGYTTQDLDAYREKVAALITGLLSDSEGIVGQAPHLFNFHRVDVASQSDDLLNQSRNDTAFGGRLVPDPAGITLDRFLSVDGWNQFAARQNAPDDDVVVVVMNLRVGRPLAGRGNILLNADSDDRTLTHEMGHALIGLGDEYSETSACYPHYYVFSTSQAQEPMNRPNISFDPSGAKWAELVRGALPGGDRYGSCIYRPPEMCRMRGEGAPRFCRVCQRAIRKRLSLDPPDCSSPPQCVIRLSHDPNAGAAVLWVYAYVAGSGHPITAWTLSVDGQELILSNGPSLGSGTWLRADERGEGPHRVHLSCTDSSGARSEASVTVELRRAAP